MGQKWGIKQKIKWAMKSGIKLDKNAPLNGRKLRHKWGINGAQNAAYKTGKNGA